MTGASAVAGAVGCLFACVVAVADVCGVGDVAALVAAVAIVAACVVQIENLKCAVGSRHWAHEVCTGGCAEQVHSSAAHCAAALIRDDVKYDGDAFAA